MFKIWLNSEVQKKHTNAFERWKVSDVEFLKDFWSDTSNMKSEDEKIKELMQKLGRTRNGIGQKLMSFGIQLDGKFVRYKPKKERKVNLNNYPKWPLSTLAITDLFFFVFGFKTP